MSSLKHPHLAELAAFVSEIRQSAADIRNDLSPEELRWSPGDDVWSVADCFDHLISTGYLYYPRLEEAIKGADRNQAGRQYEPSVLAKLFIWTISPDAGIKVRAFEPFEPKHPEEDTAILEMFDEQQSELLALISKAEEVNINGGKFITPGLVRLTVGEGLTMVVQHQRRHMLQVERLQRHPNFPGDED
ncbi:MAG: DinB family protein [Rhodothermales bacterium]|nr:DinB family protein [Rhodothermales bacterium]